MRGGYGNSGLGSLASRTSAEAPGASEPASPARHCLVAGAPALLVEWRRGSGGWEGRVISMLWLEGAGWATVEQWLAAGEITSAAL